MTETQTLPRTLPIPDDLLGVCLRDVGSSGGSPTNALNVHDAITAVSGLNAARLHLPSVRAVSDELDEGLFTDAADHAGDAGVRLSASLPAVHPDRRSAAWGNDPASPHHPFAQISAGNLLEIDAFHVTVGVEDDRLRGPADWRDQLVRTVPVLRDLVARSAVPVVLKTHEEMTSREVEYLVTEVPGLHVGFSPVNVLARLEDPYDVAVRLRPHVHSLFLDDAETTPTTRGARRTMRRIGFGTVPWKRILREMPGIPTYIDLHRAELDMPFRDASWLSHEPQLTATDIERAVRNAVPESKLDALDDRLRTAHEILTARYTP